jgi:hypothetical protein
MREIQNWKLKKGALKVSQSQNSWERNSKLKKRFPKVWKKVLSRFHRVRIRENEIQDWRNVFLKITKKGPLKVSQSQNSWERNSKLKKRFSKVWKKALSRFHRVRIRERDSKKMYAHKYFAVIFKYFKAMVHGYGWKKKNVR